MSRDIYESKLHEVTRDLRERIKELNCLYGVSRLVEKEDASIDNILQGVVELMPPSWQYPEDTCAGIKLKDKAFTTANFQETAWKQVEMITVHGSQFGTLEVCYLRKKPEHDEGPFLKEERNLIHAVAERVGHIIEHKLAESELQSLYDQEKELREKLQEEMRARIDFTRKLIHELKTPLTALVATSQLLLEETEGKELGKLARHVWEGANSLNSRIDELHDVVKGEMGTLKVEPKPLDLRKLLLSLVDEIRPLSQQNDVSIELILRERLPKVYADAARVRQIMLNLLNNAFKYASNGKRLTISSTVKSGFVMVGVRDYGPGIARNQDKKLLESGYQLAYVGEGRGGLGIGLALCKILVELQGGTFQVRSRPGKGAGFFFTLPLLRDCPTKS